MGIVNKIKFWTKNIVAYNLLKIISENIIRKREELIKKYQAHFRIKRF